MSTLLYLDTARLGRMCPEAQAADHDFARLAGEEGCSLYFEQFLRCGFTALPPSLARQYPGLSFWAGVTAFKNDLKTAICLPRQRRVLVANASMQNDLLRWSLLLSSGGWYFDCDVRLRLTLDEIENDCQLDGKKCFVTLFGSAFSPPASDILGFGPDWPGRAAVIDYVCSQRDPDRIHHWTFAGEMIGTILREHPEWYTVAPPERYSMLTALREKLVFLRGGQAEKGLVRRRQARSAKKPKPRTPLDAERRRGLIDSMRQSVAAFSPGADRVVMEQRLAKCEACDLMRFSGCGLPCSCNGRWAKWRERIIEGNCEQFSDVTQV